MHAYLPSRIKIDDSYELQCTQINNVCAVITDFQTDFIRHCGQLK